MVKKIMFGFLLLKLTAWSQVPASGRYERCWALAHPLTALRVKSIIKKCNVFTKQIFLQKELDDFINGGRLDAYRHSFYMAACAQKIKTKKLRKLGIAHEKTNYSQFLKSKKEEGELADSLSTVMDLFNNELGFKIGTENKNESFENLSKITIGEIKNGKALIMKRNKAGEYLDCNGNSIDPEEYKKVWSIPKCLVSSESDR